MQLQTRPEQTAVLPEHEKAIASSIAGRQLSLLAKLATASGGAARAAHVIGIACDFFQANGTAYRLLEADRDTRRIMKQSEPAGAVLPKSPQLWVCPSINFQSSALGRDSMIGVDRDNLVAAANRFFATGIRCQWFEKMLVEAVLGAETFATVQESRRNPALWYGYPGFARSIYWAWAYEVSRGKSPKLELIIWAGSFLFGVLKIGAILALAWYSYSRIENDQVISGLLGLGIAALAAINVIGRYVTQRIVHWTRPALERAIATMSALPAGSALMKMIRTFRVAAVPSMSLALVRSQILDATASDVMFDSIALALVERGIANGEHLWNSASIASYWGSEDAAAEEALLWTEDSE